MLHTPYNDQLLPHSVKFDLQLFCVAFPLLASFACHSPCLDMLYALQRVTLNLPYHFSGMQHMPAPTLTHRVLAVSVLVDFLISVWRRNKTLLWFCG